MPHDPAAALDLALYQIRRKHGAGAIYRLGEQRRRPLVGWSTGALSLDLALGGAGVPRGRVVEIYGAEASGKTTLALHVAAETQRAGGTAAFIDVEHALDPGYAKALGVDLDALLFSQPASGDEALGIVEALCLGGGVDLVVIDSLAALQPREDLDAGFDAPNPASLARLLSAALRRLVPAAARGPTTVLFVNQLRHEIREGRPGREITPGGWALRFYAAVRIDVRQVGDLRDGTTRIGTRTRARVVKNKVAPPFREAEFDLHFGRGIDRVADLLACGRAAGLVTGRGTVSFGDRTLGRAAEAAATLSADATLATALATAVREHWAHYEA